MTDTIANLVLVELLGEGKQKIYLTIRYPDKFELKKWRVCADFISPGINESESINFCAPISQKALGETENSQRRMVKDCVMELKNIVSEKTWGPYSPGITWGSHGCTWESHGCTSEYLLG